MKTVEPKENRESMGKPQTMCTVCGHVKSNCVCSGIMDVNKKM